ncbi:hypothetical protein [Aeromicrobium sp. UC242_57]|uniref:hypothetical protein n=1 Tax=Aeromicrobium sp. UC242_57 TaxID=3374624 RepID=UPI0037BED44C
MDAHGRRVAHGRLCHRAGLDRGRHDQSDRRLGRRQRQNYATVDGREYYLDDFPPVWDWGQFFESDVSYDVGQRVEIALDLDDPRDVSAYDVSRYDGFSWWRAIAGLAFLLGLAGLARQWLTRNTLLTDGARWQLWRTGRTFTVTVVEVRERKPHRLARFVEAVLEWFSDHTHEHHHLVLEGNGRVFYWEAKSEDDTTIEPGMTFEVVGRLRRRGWIVALTEPRLYPAARLD